MFLLDQTEMSEPFSIDPKLLAALDDISLVARTVVEGFLSGLHRSPFLGYSTEFSSYRQYIQGDNLRHVDWKVWGRTDELYVKQFEDDTNVSCQIVLDTSASMDFGTPNKFQYARMLAASLSYLMVRQHDAPGLVLHGETTFHALPARSGRRHLDDVFALLANTRAVGHPLSGASLQGVLETFTRRGIAIVISDLFSPDDGMVELFRQLHFHRQEVIVFHVVAPEEMDFNFDGEYLMEDSETGQVIPIHASAFRKEYSRRVETFCRTIEDQCAGLEIDYQRVRTDQPLDVALIGYLSRRSVL